MTQMMTRKQFGSALMGGTVLLLIQACGGGGSDYATAPSGADTAKSGCSDTISDNHGHILAVALADLDSTTDRTYDIHGTADHTHTVTMTAANLAKLKSAASVSTTTSTTLSHFHTITVTCI